MFDVNDVPLSVDPNEPIEDLVARVRERAAANFDDLDTPRWRREAQRRRHTRGWVRRNALNLALAGVCVVIVGIFVAAQRGASTTRLAVPERGRAIPDQPGEALPTSTSRTENAKVSGNAGVPAAWRSRCRVASSIDERAGGQWSCRLRPSLTVEVLTFNVSSDAERRVGLWAGDGLSVRPECSAADGVLATWSLPSAPAKARGKLWCGISARGAEIVWTVGDAMAVRAIGADGDLEGLFAWWNSLANRPNTV